MQAKFLIEALNAQKSFEIVYITYRAPPDYQPEDHRIVHICKFGWRHKFGYFWDALPLYRILSEQKPDIIYQRVACGHTGICAAYARQSGARMIWHVASSSDCEKMRVTLGTLLRPYRLIEKKLIEFGLQNTDFIVAQTQDQISALLRNYGRQTKKLVRNFHTIPPEPTKNTDEIEVLWVGNFKDCKQPEKFLDLAEALMNVPRVKFTMIGEPYLENRKQNAFERRINTIKKVEYIGGLTQEQVKKRMSAAHILVNTSTREGFSNTFIEAWMHSMVVLSMEVNPDNMLDGGPLGRSCGNLVDLGEALKELTRKPKILRHMGQKARIFAINEFSMNNAMQLITIFREIANEIQSDP